MIVLMLYKILPDHDHDMNPTSVAYPSPDKCIIELNFTKYVMHFSLRLLARDSIVYYAIMLGKPTHSLT